jgi:ammonium transporter
LVWQRYLVLYLLPASLPGSLVKLVMGIRVSEDEEYQGVDYSECGMEAYPEFTDSSKG